MTADLAGEVRAICLALPEVAERPSHGAPTWFVQDKKASVTLWARAHHDCLRIDDPVGAARCALWLGLALMNRGEMAQGGGWFARARGLLDDGQRDCAECGFLLVPVALQCLFSGDAETAYATFVEIAAIGDRFRNPDLMTFGRLGRGQTLIDMRRVAEGVVLLDEAMIAVTAGERVSTCCTATWSACDSRGKQTSPRSTTS